MTATAVYFLVFASNCMFKVYYVVHKQKFVLSQFKFSVVQPSSFFIPCKLNYTEQVIFFCTACMLLFFICNPVVWWTYPLQHNVIFCNVLTMNNVISFYYSLRPKILVIEMDVSRCILVLDTSILMTSNSGRREYLVQTRNKVGVGEFSMCIGLGTNRKERGWK